MTAQTIANGLYMIPAGNVNVYLIESEEGLILIDAGFPNTSKVILDAIRGLEKLPQDVKHIVLTHAHYDHIGSLAPLVAATGAQTWMHHDDCAIAQSGQGFRPMKAAPGLLRGLMFRLFVPANPKVEPVTIDHQVKDGETLPLAGGLRVIHVPGHCLGQIALLWPSRGALIAGDSCSSMFGLGDSLGYEDYAEALRSQKKLASLDFNIACFGHGKPILQSASAKFRERFGELVTA